MRKKLSVILLSLFMATASLQATLTLEETVLKQNKPETPSLIVPSIDGKTYISKDAEGNIVKFDYKTGKPVEALFDFGKLKNVPTDKWEGFIVSPDETHLLLYINKKNIYRYSFSADFYVYEVKRNKLRPLSEKGAQESPVFSPDNRMIAFVRDNNIFIKKLDFDSEVAVTTNGKKNEIINGIPDWVYQEEFGLLSSLRFSPDSQVLSFVQWDERKVKSYDMTVFSDGCSSTNNAESTIYPGSFNYKYPVAGEVNSKVRLLCYEIDNRKTKEVKLPIKEDDYIPNITYATESNKLYAMTLNRNQNRFQIYEVNPRSTISKLIYTDESMSWINIEDIMRMTKFGDDSFIIPSERDGYNHLYKYALNGTLLSQITKGDWDVTDYYGHDNLTNTYYFQATKEGAINRTIVKKDRKGLYTNVSKETGWNIAQFNNNFSYYVLNYSNAKTPNQYTICSKGKKIREIEMNSEYASHFSNAVVPQKEFFTFSHDGNTFNGYMIKPLNFDANKKYPVIMSQYSGPGSQQVKNIWRLEWEQYAATQGYIVACIDGRGTGGRGREWKAKVYMQLGKYESIDQIAGANYMASLPYVDSKKIGIYGWSFGGYETLMAMSQPNSIYAAGVSIAPVTDWRYYDTIYTERFMRTPQENNEGYNQSSAINVIPNLKGELLIMAGTSDDNVHITNTYQYVANLTLNNKICNMMIFPGMNHSIYYCDARLPLYMRVIDFFNKNLK